MGFHVRQRNQQRGIIYEVKGVVDWNEEARKVTWMKTLRAAPQQCSQERRRNVTGIKYKKRVYHGIVKYTNLNKLKKKKLAKTWANF